MARCLFLADNSQTRWLVDDTHRRCHFVDILAAVAAGVIDIDTKFVGVYLHLHFVRHRQHCHRGR